jgi:hypothetical protein
MFLVHSRDRPAPARGKFEYRGQFDANAAWSSLLESTKLSALVEASDGV